MPSRTPSHAANTSEVPPVPHSIRALAPLAGLLLVAMTVLLAVGVTAATTTLGPPADPAPSVVISMDVQGDRVTLSHDGGDSLSVDELSVRVSVNGEPLARQPPIPFFSAAGFKPGPTGAFNAASGDEWVVGGSASFRVAGTNDPSIEPGDRVTLRLVVRERLVATLEATARPG